MPYEIVFDDLPAGYSLSYAKKGDEAFVRTIEFTSSEDGDEFIARLEGFPAQILGMLTSSENVKPSTVDHLLAIIRRDKTATVYVNELSFLAYARVKRDVEKGTPVLFDNIADVERLSIDGVSIPSDAGFAFLFSCGWRKGFFYDFSPLASEISENRNYDLEVLLGHYWSYLTFQFLFKIRDSEWDQMFNQKWFPFISLRSTTIQNIVDRIRAGWDLDELLEPIAQEVADSAESMREKWQRNQIFCDHLPILDKGLERFLTQDYISAISILYPRIEGIMRTHHMRADPLVRPSQKNLVASSLKGEGITPRNLLLPERFEFYLREIYFAYFDPVHPSVLSRHSVAHGVAPADLFNLKAATISLLILEQLSFYLQTG